tara:strand:+ start:1066 stop:1698 length:633 start_codon:yes stop_codon:yes gene_type:complete
MQPTNPYIWSKKKALPKKLCKSLIKKFKKDEDSYQGLIGERTIDTSMKSSIDLYISDKDRWSKEDNQLFRSLTKSLEEYRDFLTTTLDLTFFKKRKNTKTEIHTNNGGSNDVFDSGYQIQETQIDHYYDWHHDGRIDINDGKASTRTITYLWYLNDIDDGGETEFYDGTLIKPEAGKLILFPATWSFMHRGRPPKSNVKYICTGWVYDGT